MAGHGSVGRLSRAQYCSLEHTARAIEKAPENLASKTLISGWFSVRPEPGRSEASDGLLFLPLSWPMCEVLARIVAMVRFARSTRHLLVALEEFNHLGVRFISVQDQVDTDSPMGRAIFTIIGAMAELESSLISERVTAGMRAAEIRGKHLGRPAIQQRIIREIETLATSTDLSIRQIQSKIAGRASRGIVGEITKRARSAQSAAL
jgi:Resolvase, N terminal domain